MATIQQYKKRIKLLEDIIKRSPQTQKELLITDSLNELNALMKRVIRQAQIKPSKSEKVNWRRLGKTLATAFRIAAIAQQINKIKQQKV